LIFDQKLLGLWTITGRSNNRSFHPPGPALSIFGKDETERTPWGRTAENTFYVGLDAIIRVGFAKEPHERDRLQAT